MNHFYFQLRFVEISQIIKLPKGSFQNYLFDQTAHLVAQVTF